MLILDRTIRFFSASVVCCVALVPAIAGARTWTNLEGETIEAEFSHLRDGRMVLLRADDKTIRAPLAKLSEADRQWVKKQIKIAGPRNWGTADGSQHKGKFVSIRNDKIRVKLGSKTSLIPLSELSLKDWNYIERLHEHLETELPEEFVAARPLPEDNPSSPIASASSDNLPRDWTDITGRKITAHFLGTRGQKVRLLIRDREFSVPVQRLSQADKTWIAEHNLSQLSSQLSTGLTSAMGLLGAAANALPPSNNPPEQIPTNRLAVSNSGPEYDQPPTPSTERPRNTPPTEELPTDELEGSYVASNDSDLPTPSSSQLSDKPFQPLEHIDELSIEEIDARLEEVFGDAESVGIAECEHCEAAFSYPEDFVEGSPCPFCQTAVTELLSFDEITEELQISFSGSSTPWYFRRGFRRLFFFVLIGGTGVLIKSFANSAA